MINIILLLAGAGLSISWGIAHLVPTNNIVKDFGKISEDNKKIVQMEWINEGVTLIFIGAVVVITAFSTNSFSLLSIYINTAAAIMLSVMAIISLFTGFKIRFIPFKLCPFFFLSSAMLIILGTYLKVV